MLIENSFHCGYFTGGGGGGGGLCAAKVINALSGAIEAGGAFAIASAAINAPMGAAGRKEKNALRFMDTNAL
jgi:hypothetical protein